MKRRRLQALACALLVAAGTAGAEELKHDQEGVPASLSWQATLTPLEEPGETMIVSGTVYAPDGKTPAPGVTIYAYQTDAKGHYVPGGQRGTPRIRGWMKSDGSGHFEFRSIKPGAYPGNAVPAHVHFVLWGGGYPRQWADELQFEGDPSVSAKMLATSSARGLFANVRPLLRAPDGALRCTIRLRLAAVSNF